MGGRDLTARIKRFRGDFDLDILQREFERTELEGHFAGTIGMTLEFLDRSTRNNWGDSHIKHGISGGLCGAYRRLRFVFEQESAEFIKAHDEYREVLARFEARTSGMKEGHASYHKYVFLFEQESKKLLDGTVVWHMQKFIDKLESAFRPTLTDQPRIDPMACRTQIARAFDILEMGLAFHFPAADKRPSRDRMSALRLPAIGAVPGVDEGSGG